MYSFNLTAQELYALHPINYPKTSTTSLIDSSTFFEKFNIAISRDKKDIFYKGNLIFKCEFQEYNDYLIEIFQGVKNYLFVSPLPKIKGIASPYNINRGILFLVNCETGVKYYANLDSIKKIQTPKGFEFGKSDSASFMVKEINECNQELVFIQGGVVLNEVKIKIFKY